jgi:hypothetical protein
MCQTGIILAAVERGFGKSLDLLAEVRVVGVERACYPVTNPRHKQADGI